MKAVITMKTIKIMNKSISPKFLRLIIYVIVSVLSVILLCINRLPNNLKCIEHMVKSINSMNFEKAIEYLNTDSEMISYLGNSGDLSRADYASMLLNLDMTDVEELNKISLIGIKPSDGTDDSNISGTAYLKIKFIRNNGVKEECYMEYQYKIIKQGKKYILEY